MPEATREEGGAPVRSFWSGTITFGLVSIPVDLFSAVRPRQKSMKLVDNKGHALGRQYHCAKEGKKLSSDELVRGFETEAGKVVVITDEEFASVAPEDSRDIELRRFVPLDQIPPMYFDRPYFLAPAGRSAKAYNLLAKTMERSGRVAIGSFVMRGKEYLIAIVSENGVMRAETLRHADEVRSPGDVGLPKQPKVAAKKVSEFEKEIAALAEDTLSMSELEDREAEALQELAEKKRKQRKDVLQQTGLEDEESEGGGAQIIDLMQVLRKSLAKNAKVATAEETLSRKPPKAAGAKRSSSKPANGSSSRSRSTSKSAPAEDELADASKGDLYKMATDLDIAGRSKMDKDQLIAAIRKAR